MAHQSPQPYPPGEGYDDEGQGRCRVIAGYKREALLRLKTVRGHIDGVIGMVEDEVYCPDLMKQVAAPQASLEKVNRVLLRNHLETCMSEAIRTGQGQERTVELREPLPYNPGRTDSPPQAEPLPLAGSAAGGREVT